MKNKQPAAEKPKAIEIITVKRTRKTIYIKWRQGDGVFDLNERDNPLPDFLTAMDALAPIAGTICHLPRTYETGLRVVGFTIGEQSGAQTVFLIARKDIDDAAKEFAFTTPARLLAHPAEPGKYTPPLDEADASAVVEAIEQAKLYVRGERAQGQIAFEDDQEGEEDTDTQEGDDLPFSAATPPPPEDKPKKKRKE